MAKNKQMSKRGLATYLIARYARYSNRCRPSAKSVAELNRILDQMKALRATLSANSVIGRSLDRQYTFFVRE